MHKPIPDWPLSTSPLDASNQLERKRNGLQHWAGGGTLGWKTAGATFVFFLIGLDLLPLFLRWLTGLPSLISTNLAVAILGVIILSMFWTVVRTRSLHAARAIQDELDALDNVERKQ